MGGRGAYRERRKAGAGPSGTGRQGAPKSDDPSSPLPAAHGAKGMIASKKKGQALVNEFYVRQSRVDDLHGKIKNLERNIVANRTSLRDNPKGEFAANRSANLERDLDHIRRLIPKYNELLRAHRQWVMVNQKNLAAAAEGK